MEGKIERYRQEIAAATKPVSARLEQYHKVIFELRKLLKDYFFNTWRTLKLTEVAKGEELLFSFNMVQSAMEQCLVEEQTLAETAQEIETEENSLLVAAFDLHALKSGLPLELNKENGLYQFKPEKPYTPMAQVYMRQFAYALSIYRVCLGICENYYSIYSHKGTETNQQQDCIESARSLKQQLSEGILISLYEQTRITENEIINLLRTERVYEGLNEFKEDIDSFKNKLTSLLETGAEHIQNSYKEFPNNAILWILHDRSWHALIKTISGLLYAQQYTYSTLYGTLEIKKEFIGLIKSEIENFESTASTKTPLLKIELLKSAAKIVSETKIDVLANLAEKRIPLDEAPKVSNFFSSIPVESIYQRMFAYRPNQLARINTFGEQEEDHSEEEFNEQITFYKNT